MKKKEKNKYKKWNEERKELNRRILTILSSSFVKFMQLTGEYAYAIISWIVKYFIWKENALCFFEQRSY